MEGIRQCIGYWGETVPLTHYIPIIIWLHEKYPEQHQVPKKQRCLV